MTQQGDLTAAEIDRAEYTRIRKQTLQEQLVYAARKSGRSALTIQRDFSRLERSDSKLNMTEFLLHGMHYEGRYTAQQLSEFIGNKIHWPIAHACNDPGWLAAAEDKVLSYTIMGADNLPIPQNLAVIDTSQRTFPELNKITTPQELKNLCLPEAGQGLFGKIIGGMIGFGVFRIESATESELTCTGIGPISYDDFFTQVVGDNSYLIQRQLRNHSEIAPYASALATVRMINLVRDQDIYVPMAAMALSQGNNIADAFWRDGNIACAIDVQSGELTTVAQRDEYEIVYLDDHPNIPGLKGRKLPFWEELKEINERAARLFAPMRYQSTDIAITETGPVIVEINYGCGFGLPQQASGKGLLTKEVRSFFENCGYDFAAKPKRRFSLFKR